MLIIIDTEKAFGKIQHFFTIKTLRYLAMERNFLNMINGIYKKKKGNIRLNSERLNAFPPLRSRTKQEF